MLDCVCPRPPGIEFIESVQSKSALHVPPVLSRESRSLSDQQVAAIHHCARVGPVRYAPTIERVLEEIRCCCCIAKESSSHAEQKRVLAEVRQTDPMLCGRKVLVIDDDLRNIFALTSVLEHREIKTLHAENGRAGIELLEERAGRGYRADGYHDAGNGRL